MVVVAPEAERVKEEVVLTPVNRDCTKKMLQDAAQKIAAEPLRHSPDHVGVWAFLVPLSPKARSSFKGKNITLKSEEHILGRLAKVTCFQCDSPTISGKHCKIYRKKVAVDGTKAIISHSPAVYIKDTSSNGTYINWEILKKDAPGVELFHGDVISLAHAPEVENAFAFVYYEAKKSAVVANSPELILSKRKTDFVDHGPERKKAKGLGIGAPEGPISLDDVRLLQRSNEDLRKKLETHVLTIETLHSEARAAVVRHENELKEQKESVSLSYIDEIKDVRCKLEAKQKELDEVLSVSADRKNSMDDLHERLTASIQSRADADRVISSQKATISELESQLEEERNQRRVEREKATEDLKVALQRARLEAQEEAQRQNDIALRQQHELQEVINKLQESDKESRALVESLRMNLEDARESFLKSEKKVRQLEALLHVEQLASAGARKKAESMEAEMSKLRNDLELEKVAREDAWAKVSSLEVEMAAAIRDLSIEKQRFQGARERIILRETQLRSFYSTTEEISALLGKQQAQIKAMQRTLEDEENYQIPSVDIGNHTSRGNTHEILRSVAERRGPKSVAGEASTGSTPKNTTNVKGVASDGSSTEKYYCGHKSHECVEENSQNEECTSKAQENQAFGLDIDLVDTFANAGNPVGDEQVVGTETQPIPVVQQMGSHKSDCLAGDTMQVDEQLLGTIGVGARGSDCEEKDSRGSDRQAHLGVPDTMEEDTQAGSKDVQLIATDDLLASEAIGSWAESTAPSCHGENESPGSGGQAGARVSAHLKIENLQQNLFSGRVGTHQRLLVKHDQPSMTDEDNTEIQMPQAVSSQSVPTQSNALSISQEHRALSAMIDIVDPSFRKKFQDTEKIDESSSSDDKTEEYSGSSEDGTDEGTGESD